MNDLTIAVCNFNTTDLTNACIRSAIKVGLNEHKFIVLDNSNKQKFECDSDIRQYVNIIDNTQGKFIDFNKALNEFSTLCIAANSNGSLKHCYSIQFLINICPTKKLLLLDSDIVFNKAPDFISDNIVTAAEIEYENTFCERCGKVFAGKTRFAPILQYINVEMLKSNHVTYFNALKMHGGLVKTNQALGNHYDTGAWMYEQVKAKRLPFREIKYSDYITHLNHGSWKHDN